MRTKLYPILTAADLSRSLAFYRDLLGYAVTYQFPPDGEPAYVGLRSGESDLGIGALEPGAAPLPAADGRFALCGYVEDCDEAVRQLREHGVPVLAEPADQPWGERMAYVADPDGNRVMLLQTL
jgi:lactoylglutathione lyase